VETHLQPIDWVKQAGASIGFQIAFKSLPSKRSIRLASQGQLDGEFYRHTVIESRFPTLVRVNVAIGHNDYFAWVHENKTCMKDRNALSELKPVGHLGAFFFTEQVYPLSRAGFEEVDDMAKTLIMLERGRADYTVHDEAIIHDFSVQTGIRLKRCLDEPLFSMPFYLYLHESKRELVPVLEQALRAIVSPVHPLQP
jgi:hypothetical protein